MELSSLSLARLGESNVAATPRELFETHQHVVKEEGQPHALPLAAATDQIHPVIPIAGTHEWEAVFTQLQPIVDRSSAMVIECRGFL
jgi:hypothetical protein